MLRSDTQPTSTASNSPLPQEQTQAHRSTPSSATGRKTPESGLKIWMGVIESCIKALETTVWQGRDIADQALKSARTLHVGAVGMGEDLQRLADQARLWPARLKRVSQTGWMLTKILGSYRLWGTRSAFLPHAMQEKALNALHRKNARRFRDTSLAQGGAFLKIGQLLSSRPDLLPAAWIEELEALQDQATPVPFEQLQPVLEAELGQPIEALFAHIDPTPLATASIGQVHRAQLHDGRNVAVKVQRPGLDTLIELDMALLKLFLNAVRSALPPVDMDTIINEIQRTVREELDYHREAQVMQRIQRQLSAVDGISTPNLVAQFSTRHVLTSEFVEGEKLTHVLDNLHQREPEQVDTLLHTLLDAWFCQVLHGGLFHADPHPGNILVNAQGQLILLDFGCAQSLSDTARRGYFRVLQACAVNDQQEIATTLHALGFRTRSGNPDTLLAFVGAILDEVRDAMINPHAAHGWPDSDTVMDTANTLLAQMADDPVEQLPADFIMLARVFGTLGGLFLHYQPNSDITGLILQYLTRPIEPASLH